MILVMIAIILFLCFGKTGKLIRRGLFNLACNTIIFFGVPLFAAWMYYIKVS